MTPLKPELGIILERQLLLCFFTLLMKEWWVYLQQYNVLMLQSADSMNYSLITKNLRGTKTVIIPTTELMASRTDIVRTFLRGEYCNGY